MSTAAEKRRLRRLHKQAAERLMEDSRLWDGLPDEQAQQLLKWGLDQVKKVLPKLGDMDDGEAETWLDEQTAVVAQMMTQITTLTPDLPELDVDAFKEQIKSLYEKLQELTGNVIDEIDLDWLTFDHDQWDASEAFQQLLHMLGFEEEET